MNTHLWSFILSWSRVGINAALFLAATRVLSLAEIGLFATAFAPIRLTQGLHKAGIPDAVIVLRRPKHLDALLILSTSLGAALTTLFAILGALLSPILLTLSVIPAINGLGAVSEGILRQKLHLKGLALRTLATQSIAAAAALWMLATGWGVTALIAFALINAGLTCALSITLARWRPKTIPKWRYQTLMWPKTSQIVGRVLLATSQIPLAQLAIGLTLGPTAAGAFQIATRMLELIEALTLSPLRFIALPQLSHTKTLRTDLHTHLRHTTTLAAWVWGGTIAAAPEILTLAVGSAPAPAATPVLRALAVLGLLSAILMPLTQALTAHGHTKLVLKRAALSLALSTTLIAPALAISTTAAATALSLAATLTALWFTKQALTTLNLTASDLAPAILPLLAGTTMCAMLTLTSLPLSAQIALGTAFYAAIIGLSRLPQRHLA
jgi:O-antigen/teichoic acid export membrane protein